jgi:hypothetical protein
VTTKGIETHASRLTLGTGAPEAVLEAPAALKPSAGTCSGTSVGDGLGVASRASYDAVLCKLSLRKKCRLGRSSMVLRKLHHNTLHHTTHRLMMSLTAAAPATCRANSSSRLASSRRRQV